MLVDSITFYDFLQFSMCYSPLTCDYELQFFFTFMYIIIAYGSKQVSGAFSDLTQSIRGVSK